MTTTSVVRFARSPTLRLSGVLADRIRLLDGWSGEGGQLYVMYPTLAVRRRGKQWPRGPDHRGGTRWRDADGRFGVRMGI